MFNKVKIKNAYLTQKRTLIMFKITCTLFLLMFFISGNAQAEQSLADALEEKLIQTAIKGSWDGIEPAYFDPNGQYFGKCMNLKIRNISAESLLILVDPGLMLMSDDTVAQDMLITKKFHVELAKNESKTMDIYAMCSEIHDGQPFSAINYSVGAMADSNLVSIAQTVNDMYMQNICGQGAVWAYTDKATEDDLMNYGATESSIENTKIILENAGVSTPLHEIEDDIALEDSGQKVELTENKTTTSSGIPYSTFIGVISAGALTLVGFLVYFMKYQRIKVKKELEK
ncbi:MAG: hypothetical protein ACI857_000601 [Arenicella sp.]|jgi:hypothetical protein